ncbi:hypothetical protein BpHYR1_010724 [Brachionus plicatilis]|uniref:Uncharacterized protein n=1 Tax=Brachionus plicatilis TaxID=10195 RepID=A0A3M7SYV5_BRAPC|nr:hypothetical protein BpHYR1_010724 [Brachionus plicatilis]
MSSLIMETSKANFNDFEKNLNYNFTTTSINKNFVDDSSMEKKFYQFRKLFQSLEDIESNLGQLNERNSRYNATCSQENVISANTRLARSESCDYSREKNPFYSASMKSVKFKDLDRFSPICRSNGDNITKEISDLKSKINCIRESNSSIKITKNQLQNQIENLQDNISKSLKKSGTMTNSFERIDSQFFEINRILNDLNESKALLRKTRIRQNDARESMSPTFKENQPVSLTVKLNAEPEKPENFEFEKLMAELEHCRRENLKLKSKLSNIEIKNEKDEFLKKMSSSCLFNDVPNHAETQILKENLDHLSTENSSLKSELDQIKNFNKNELARIRNEFDVLKDSHFNEIKLKSKTNRDLQSEISSLKSKLKQEENIKEKMRADFEQEMDSAKVRFETELNRQNSLMQSKYDDMLKEMENFNKLVNQLQNDKYDLINIIKKDRAKKKAILTEKCTTTTTTKLSQNINKASQSQMTSSLNDFCESTILSLNNAEKVNLKETKKDTLHSSTLIYDTGNHSRNLPVRYVTSYNLSPSRKVFETNAI